MWYDRDTIDQITIQVNDIFNGMALIIDVLIKMSVLIACLDILINRFDEIASNLDQTSEYECGYDNNMDTITITNGWYKIGNVTPIVRSFLTTIHFTIKVIDVLPIKLILFLEFDVIIVAVNPLISILTSQSSITVIDCDTPIIHNVCVAFFCIFYFSVVFHSCDLSL